MGTVVVHMVWLPHIHTLFFAYKTIVIILDLIKNFRYNFV